MPTPNRFENESAFPSRQSGIFASHEPIPDQKQTKANSTPSHDKRRDKASGDSYILANKNKREPQYSKNLNKSNYEQDVTLKSSPTSMPNSSFNTQTALNPVFNEV